MDFVSRAAAIATAAMASATAVADAVAVRAAAATEVTRAVAAQGLGHFLVAGVQDVQDVHAVHAAVHGVTIDERLQEFIAQYKADSEAAKQHTADIEARTIRTAVALHEHFSNMYTTIDKFIQKNEYHERSEKYEGDMMALEARVIYLETMQAHAETKFITNKDHYKQQLEVNTRLDNLLVPITSQQALLDDLLADSKATKQRIVNNELCCVREQLAVDKRIDRLLLGIKKRSRDSEESDSEESDEDCCTNYCTDGHDNGPRAVCRRVSCSNAHFV